MPKTVDDLLRDARARLERVTPEKAWAELEAGTAVLVDTRTFEQRRDAGEIPGAIVVDRTVFEWRLDPASPSRIPEIEGPETRVIVMCRQGYSSSLAAATLHELGLRRATDVIGGVEAWRDAGLPLVPGPAVGT
jgi:rhodanese-related sulfurtransferase